MPFDVLEPETTSKGYEILEPEGKGYEVIEPERSRAELKAGYAQQKRELEEAARQGKGIENLISLAQIGLKAIAPLDVTGTATREMVRQGEQPLPPVIPPQAFQNDVNTVVGFGSQGLRNLGIPIPTDIQQGISEFGAETLSSMTDPTAGAAMIAGGMAPKIAGPAIGRYFQAKMASEIPAATEAAMQAETPSEQVKAGLGVASLAALPIAIQAHLNRVNAIQIPPGIPSMGRTLEMPRGAPRPRVEPIPIERLTGADLVRMNEQMNREAGIDFEPEKGTANAESIRASEGQLPQTRVEPQGIQEAGGNVVEQKPPGQPQPVVQGGQPQAQSEVLLTPNETKAITTQQSVVESFPEGGTGKAIPSQTLGHAAKAISKSKEESALLESLANSGLPVYRNIDDVPNASSLRYHGTLAGNVTGIIENGLTSGMSHNYPSVKGVGGIGDVTFVFDAKDSRLGVISAADKPHGMPIAVVLNEKPASIKGPTLDYALRKAAEAKPSLSDQGTAPEAPAPSAASGEIGNRVVEQPTTQPPAISEAKPLVENTQVTQTMPPEQSIGGALPEEITKPGTYVSNMFAAIDRDRAEMGKPPMEATKRRTWDEDNAKALARMNKDPEWIPNLLAAMTVEPRPMLSWEIAGTVWQRAKWKAEIHNAERRIELAIKDNRPTDLAEAQEVRKKFEGAIELLDLTVGRNGTASEAGRSLRAQRMATGEDFDLVELRLKRVADKGRQLTDAEVKETEEKVAKPYKKVTEKLAETEEKAQEAKDENGFKDTVEQAKKERPRPEDNVQSLQEKLGERLKEEPDYDIYPLVKRLVKVLIDKEGITTRDPMYDRVHEILKEVMPNLTRREVIDAVGGYNRPIDLPMDTVSVIYRDLRGQSQQISKLEDMAKGEAPKRTGLQRGEMSDEQRRLVKQVEEAKRLGGYKVTDPARQLRTALQAAKTAVEHQIADLSKEIATKERILKTKTQMVPDQELLDLRAKRDALKAEHKAIFGERVLTPEQKAKMAEAALDRQIAEVQRQLETGEVFPPTRTPAPMPSTPGIEAKLQTLAELKLQRYYERERIQPSRTPEVQAVNKLHAAMKAAETRLVNQIASLEAQLDKRVKNVKPARVVIENAKIVELRARIADLKKTYDAVFRPPPYTDAKRLEIWKERIQDKIEVYKKRIDEKNLARKPRPQEPNLDQEAMDLRFELEKVHRVWMEMRAQDMLEKQTKLQKAIRHTIDTSNSVRALMTSFDLSAVLRQGKFIVAGHPIRGAKSFIPMLKAMWSPEAQYRINAEIRRRPNAPLYDRAGLYLAEHGGRLVQAEEAFMAKGIEKVPIVGRGVLASGRAYTTFLNKLRADSFDIMAKTLSKSGDVTLDQAKAIANYINVATGRGAGFQQGAAGLNAVFFAPRFVASRFQALALQPLWKGDWRTRKLIVKEYARFATGIAVVYALGLAAGATVETDRRSSDFGKLKFGNTRVDPLAGLGQVAVLTKRLLGGETKTLKGKVQPIRGPNVPYGGTTTMDVAGRFVRSKLNPTAGIAANLITQSDIIGRPLTVGGMVGGVFPIGWQDTLSAIKENGIPAGTALGVLSLLGEGVQVYNEEPKPAKR